MQSSAGFNTQLKLFCPKKNYSLTANNSLQITQPKLSQLIKPCPKKTYSLSGATSFQKLRKQRLHVHKLEMNSQNYSPVRTKKLLRTFEGISQLKVTPTTKEQLENFFEIYQKNSVKSLVVPIATPVRIFLTFMKFAKKFVHSKNLSMTLYTWDYTTAEYAKLLNSLLRSYGNSRRSIGLRGIVYRFHEKANSIQIQTLALAYLSKALASVRSIIIPLEVNSTNWFVNWRVENWKKFAELIVNRRRYPEPLRTNLKIKFNNGVLEQTLKSMIEQISCLLGLFFGDKAKERKNDVVELDIEIDCNKNLNGLSEFVDKVLMPISKVNKMGCKVDAKLPLIYDEEILRIFKRLEKKNNIVMEGDVKENASYRNIIAKADTQETVSHDQDSVKKTSLVSNWYNSLL